MTKVRRFYCTHGDNDQQAYLWLRNFTDGGLNL